MGGWGIIFPGQGAQYVGMGQAILEVSDVAKSVFKEADEALGYDLSRVIREGPDSKLRDTEVQQPAIVVVSIAIWQTLKTYRPDFMPTLGLGLSLGEYSAYVAAGALSLADAVRITRIRGRAMQEAVPKELGGMLAILGLKTEVVQELCLEASKAGLVEPANYNAPGQTVVSGLNRGLDAVQEKASALGARTVRLPVSAPFHSSLLAPAGAVLARALGAVTIHRGAFPVLANVDTEPCQDAVDIVPRLVAQVSKPVLFEQSVQRALTLGVEGFLELGPGRSLTSLVKKIHRSIRAVNVEDPEGLARALELV